MKLYDIGVPGLESVMQGLLQRPHELTVEDMTELLNATLQCLILGNLRLSNEALRALATNVRNVALTLPIDDARRESLKGWGEMLEEIFQ